MVCGDPLKTAFKGEVEMERVFEGKTIITKDDEELRSIVNEYEMNMYCAKWDIENKEEFINNCIEEKKFSVYDTYFIELNSDNTKIKWVGLDSESDSIGSVTFYNNDKVKRSILKEVMTFAEASQKFNLGESTLRSSIRTDRFVEGVDYKKSGKVWIITKEAMERVYGEIK